MNHSAGLSGWQEPIAPEQLADWDLATTWLAAQTPWWADRTLTGYHAMTQGFLIGEIVRRITGTTIGQFFKSEVADVLGVDFFIGLPESEESRVSVVTPPPPEDFSNDAPDSIRAHPSQYRRRRRVTPSTPWRAAEIPAANGHGNALSVATIQQVMANNGHVNGHRFFSEKTGDLVFQRQVGGVDLVLSQDVSFGLGYGLASSYVPVGPRTCFWGGFGGSHHDGPRPRTDHRLHDEQDAGRSHRRHPRQRDRVAGDRRGDELVDGLLLRHRGGASLAVLARGPGTELTEAGLAS
jgi:CubicO group peptidase (beta-lactamase class C family)